MGVRFADNRFEVEDRVMSPLSASHPLAGEIRAFDPFGVLLAQFFDLLGHGVGQIVELSGIVGEIVEFPGPATFGYKFPITDAHSFALIVGPEEGVMFWERIPFTGDNGKKRSPFQR